MPRHPEFPHENGILYLNHAGVGPWPKRTRDAVVSFAEECTVRGASEYPRWVEVETRLRGRLARLMRASSPEDVVLVKNTSEGLSLIAHGLEWRAGDEVVINDQEFPSNRWVWESLNAAYGVTVRRVRLDDGPTPEDALIAAMSPRTRLLPVSSIQYGTGLRMDLPKLAEACRARGILLCVDAIQTLGAIPLDVDADFVVADGHKWMMGPEGLGGLYIRPDLRNDLRVWQIGWHMVEHLGEFDRAVWQPAASGRRFECGSPNLLGAHALDASLSLIEEVGADRVASLVLDNARYLFEGAARRGYRVITPTGEDRHGGIVTFLVPRCPAPALQKALAAAGVICAERCGGIRFSPHFYNDREELDEALDRVETLSKEAGRDP